MKITRRQIKLLAESSVINSIKTTHPHSITEKRLALQNNKIKMLSGEKCVIFLYSSQMGC